MIVKKSMNTSKKKKNTSIKVPKEKIKEKVLVDNSNQIIPLTLSKTITNKLNKFKDQIVITIA